MLSHSNNAQSNANASSEGLDGLLTAYTDAVDCVLAENNFWDAINTQLDADSLLSPTDLAQQQSALLASDDALWDTYADCPSVLDTAAQQQLETLLPQWPQAQQAIGERQALMAALHGYSSHCEEACTFVATLPAETFEVATTVDAPPAKVYWLKSALKPFASVASIAAVLLMLAGPSDMVSQLQHLGSPSQNPLLAAATASGPSEAPSVESYVMTYCDDALVAPVTLPDTFSEMPDASQVVMMGCGSVN